MTWPRVKPIVSAPGMGFVEATLAGGIAIYLFDGIQIAPGPTHQELQPLALLLFALTVGFVICG